MSHLKLRFVLVLACLSVTMIAAGCRKDIHEAKAPTATAGYLF